MENKEIIELNQKIAELEYKIKTFSKYGLVWEKEKNLEEVIKNIFKFIPTIKFNKKDSILNNGKLNNFIFKGDNFYSLVCLNYIYKNYFDVIYIDPPYNTGHNDFIYNDKIVDNEDTYRHSKWLSFMKRRLELARELMNDQGVIFISIDDNEQANLKILCDSIFGESNFCGCIIQDKCNAQNDANNVEKNHDYVLVYLKSRTFIAGKEKKILTNKRSKLEKVLYDSQKKPFILHGGLTSGQSDSDLNHHNLCGYSIYFNEKTEDIIPLMDYDIEKAKHSNSEDEVYKEYDAKLIKQGYVPIRPPKINGRLGRWTWSFEKFSSSLDSIYIKKTKNKFSVNKKIYVEKSQILEIDGEEYYDIQKNMPLKSICEYSSADGTSELTEILGYKSNFNNPKNVHLIEHLISSHFKKDAKILDFFAGSGTTAQATLQANEYDGGSRTFVLCTNNENNICDSITIPRTKTVITGKRSDGLIYNSPISTNLAIYETELIKMPLSSDQIMYEIADKLDNIIGIKESTLIEIKKNNFLTHLTNYDSSRHVFIYSDIFMKNQFDEFKKYISKFNGEKIAYIFNTDDLANTEDYKLGKDVKICVYPAKIFQIYKEIIKQLRSEN